MKKVAKAMYGKSMMKNGGMKKMADGGGVGKSKASGGKGSISDMTPNSSSGEVNSPNTIYAPGKKKTESTKTYKTGGTLKAKKGIIMGPGDGGKKKKKSSTPPEFNTPIEKPEVSTTKKVYKNPLVARVGSYFTGKEYQKGTNPFTEMDVTRTYKDGKKTRVLKVKNQEEKKMGGAKMKMGGSTKYQKGGMTKANTMNPTSRNTAMTALGVKKKSNASSPSRFGENAVPTTGTKKR